MKGVIKNRRSSLGDYSWDFVAPGFYEDAATGKVLVVIGPGEVYSGHVRRRPRREELGFYKSYVYRCGKKIVEKYVGVDFSKEAGLAHARASEKRRALKDD